MSKKWIRGAVLAAAVASAAPLLPAQAPPATQSSVAVADEVRRDLQEQEAILNSPAATPQQRDEAGRRLVSRSSSDARQIVARVLGNPVNPAGQLAVARAMAADPTPDVAMVEPLAGLVGNDRNMTEAAAGALAAYARRGIDPAWNWLKRRADDQRLPIGSRAALIRAMGTLVAKPVAENLVNLLRDTNNDDTVRLAAAVALVEMGGLEPYIAQDWPRLLKWWDQNRNKPENQFRADIVDRKATAFPQLNDDQRRFFEQARRFARQQYLAAAGPARQTLLMDLLQNEAPQFRRIGVGFVYDDLSRQRPSPAVAERLRKMVGDSSTEVRQEVANTLGALKDANAVDALLAQFDQEPDTEVRAAIAGALGPLHDLRAVQPLIVAMDDESMRVAEASAASLKELTSVAREKDPAVVKLLTGVLRERLPKSERGTVYRQRIVESMANLGDPAFMNDFYRLLDRNESAAVRRAAILGLGAIGRTDAADQIAPLIADPERGVREEAAKQMGKVGSFPNVDALAKRMNPQIEAEESVRAALWNSIKALSEQGNPKDVDALAGQFPADPPKRLALLEIVERKLEAAQGDPQAPDSLASTRQSLGDVLTQNALATDTKDPKALHARAADKYARALAHWKTMNQPQLVDPLMDKRMISLLRAGELPQAIEFGTAEIKANKVYVQTMGAAIKRYADELMMQNKPKETAELLSAMEPLYPALGPSFAEMFRQVKDDAQKRLNNGGYYWWPGYSPIYARAAAPAVWVLPRPLSL